MLNRGKQHNEHDRGPAEHAPIAATTADADQASESAAHTDKPAKPRKKLVVIDEYCTRIKGSGCDRCFHACPHEAISFDKDNAPVMDDSLCNGCGICYGVCDAFASTKLTMDDLHARIRRIAAAGRRVYLTCRENVFPGLEVDTDVVVLPCLSMLSPEFWTLILAENIRVSIACDLVYCDDCDRGGEIGGDLFPRAIEIAENRTGKKVLFAYRIPEKQKLIEKYTDGHDALGRRAAFTGLAADVGEIATGKRRLRNSEVLQDYYEKKERQRAIARLNLSDDSVLNKLVPHGRMKRTLFPKQRMILEAVERQPDIAPKIEVAVSVTDLGLCRKTYACVDTCPTGARCPDEETGIMQVDARLCVGCGICVDTCPNGACSLEEVTAEAYIQTPGEESSSEDE
jgi:ferredoxin